MDLITEKTGEEISEVLLMDPDGFLVSLPVLTNPCFLLSALDEVFLHQRHRQRRHPSELHPTAHLCGSSSSFSVSHRVNVILSQAAIYDLIFARSQACQMVRLHSRCVMFDRSLPDLHTGVRLLQFLYALPRQEGYEFFVGQWSKHELHFTSLINIQVKPRLKPSTCLYFSSAAHHSDSCVL